MKTEVDWDKAICLTEVALFDAASEGKGKAGTKARARAKEMCLSCPIYEACLEEGIRVRESERFRAGLSARQWRARLRIKTNAQRHGDARVIRS